MDEQVRAGLRALKKLSMEETMVSIAQALGVEAKVVTGAAIFYWVTPTAKVAADVTLAEKMRGLVANSVVLKARKEAEDEAIARAKELEFQAKDLESQWEPSLKAIEIRAAAGHTSHYQNVGSGWVRDRLIERFIAAGFQAHPADTRSLHIDWSK